MSKIPFNKSKPYHKRQFHRGPRRNERIRVPQIRVIDSDGSQIGVIPTAEALKRAKEQGLDLVEVSPNAKPPVCRILDFGKYMYEESKKAKSQKSTTTKQKEVKFRINIEDHDFYTKLRRGEEFLSKGCKLKMTLMMRGREMQHKDLGFETITRAMKELEHIATADAPPKLVGRNISLTMTPLPESKRKELKFNTVDTGEDPQDEESEA